MNLKYIDDFLNKKIDENEEFIRITFYELKVERNLREEDINELLRLAKIRFQNMNYKVYSTGESYLYKNDLKDVESNDFLIAIKGEKIEIKADKKKSRKKSK